MRLPLGCFVGLSDDQSPADPDVPPTHGRLFVPYREGQVSYMIEKPAGAARPRLDQDLPLPPPHLLLGHENAAQFLDWGQLHFSTMDSLLKRSGFALAPGQRIL